MAISTGGAVSAPLIGPIAGDEPVVRPFPFPNGEYVALTIQVALEAWSDQQKGQHRSMPDEAVRRGIPDFAVLSSQQYGPRTGIRRLTNTIERFGLRGCVSTNALVAERWPDLVADLAHRGHEIVAHGYAQDQVMILLNEEEDHAVVRRSTDILESVTGQRPTGWSSHGSRRGPHTIHSLLEEGYAYTRDFRDADLPYIVAQRGDRRLLAMTRTDEINDLVLSRFGSPNYWVEYFKRNFDELYREGAEGEPKVMTCVVHSTVFGHPWGANALAECLQYVMGFPRVWHTTGRELASFYLDRLGSLA